MCIETIANKNKQTIKRKLKSIPTLTRVRCVAFRYASQCDSVAGPADYCRFHWGDWMHGSVLRYTINVCHLSGHDAAQINGPNPHCVRICLFGWKQKWEFFSMAKDMRNFRNAFSGTYQPILAHWLQMHYILQRITQKIVWTNDVALFVLILK